jgi:riboflavin biosynthesis pyrimidine reductase
VWRRQLITALWNAELIDEIDLFVQPVVLGEGVPLFLPGHKRRSLTLVEARAMPGDLVELRYRVARS